MNTSEGNKPSKGSQSRRTFIKNSSQATAAAGLTLSLASQLPIHSANNAEKLKLGVIGCGGRGTGAAAQAMKADKGVVVHAMCDVDPAVLGRSRQILSKQIPDRVNVPEERLFSGFDGYQRVIEECDVVILATSPGFRPLHFEEAVNQGKHVFMEKPVATDVAGIKRVLTASRIAKKKRLKVGVGLQRRHQPTYQNVVKRIQDGAIGRIITLRALWNGNARKGKEREAGETELQYQIRNWYYFTWLSGDHNVEQHVHNLDVANWIMGEKHPVVARGMGGREVRDNIENGQIYDHHFVEYEYEDGTLLYSQARQIRGCWTSVNESAVGTKGRADLDGQKFSITGPKQFKTRLRRREDGHQLEHYPFFKAIRDDLDYNEAETGATATMTAILGRMATYSGKQVTWDEAMASDQKLAPDNLVDFNSTAPVQPDGDGWYPVAEPGKSDPYKVWY